MPPKGNSTIERTKQDKGVGVLGTMASMEAQLV
jgi:hypothetical protein